MLRILRKTQFAFVFFWILILCCCFCVRGRENDLLNHSKYITIDEVEPGMESYCLTTFEGTKVEKFDLKVLDVVRDAMPGRDVILVQGTDERFIHAGTVAGFSGSPVYINDRLAGALSFGWYFSKDPLYGVTPIEEMLKVSQTGRHEKRPENVTYGFDFSEPLDLYEVDEQIFSIGSGTNINSGAAAPLPCPLVVSGLPSSVCEQLDSSFRPFGFMAVYGISGSGTSTVTKNAALSPGACLTVPLVTGDIQIAAIGTVTDVVGNKVYAFGHSLLGYGEIDLPMATGQVHTIVSSLSRSFKLASPLDIVGALTIDEATAVQGTIGAEPTMIPLTVAVERYNDPQKQTYNCQVADNRLLTPRLLQIAVSGAALSRGALPPDHAVEYQGNILLDNSETIIFENISTGTGLSELMAESINSAALLMNNPFKKVRIKSLDFKIRQVNENLAAHIWSVNLSDSNVKAGEEIEIEVVIESVRRQKKKYTYRFEVPESLKPGKYDLIVCGGYDYRNFLRQAASYKFLAQNARTLIEAINNTLQIKRDRLYCILVLPSDGISLEKAELPDLPATKTLILTDAKRTLRAQEYQHWIERNFQIDSIVIDSQTMQITVEE